MAPIKTRSNDFAGATSLTIHHSTYGFIDPSRHAGKLESKTVIVTGASEGLGKEISHRFHSAGANLVLVARRTEPLEKVAKELNDIRDNSAVTVSADVTDPSAIEKTVSAAITKFGSIDVLVNNAGISRICPFTEEPDLDYYWKVMEINVRGPIMLTHACLKHMKTKNSGTIISISSTAGAIDLAHASAYSTSKAALIKFQQALSMELKDTDIRLFSLHPGSMATEFGKRDGCFAREEMLKLPETRAWLAQMATMQMQSTDLSANTAVALCVEKDANLLTGRYVNAMADLGEVLEDAKLGDGSRLVKENLYWQKMEEL